MGVMRTRLWEPKPDMAIRGVAADGLKSQGQVTTTNSSNNNTAHSMQTQSSLKHIAAVAGLALLACATTRADYASAVLSDGPKAYYRLNDDTTRSLINRNSGSLGAAGDATNDLATLTGGALHSIPGAIVGDSDRAAFFDFTTRTEIPFNPALNTPNTQPFTVEFWVLPVNDQVGTGMAVVANRFVRVGGSDNRQGWVIYQRAANGNHPNTGPGVGWHFVMYDDLSTSSRLQVRSEVPFQFGKWQHVAVVYDPVLVSNATLTIYIDGVQANQAVWNGGSTGTNPGYGPCTGNHDAENAPNGQPAMALGGYNNANPGGVYGNANPWVGGLDEYAWYPAKLTAGEILAHYQNGTNANRTQSYSSLILSRNPTVYLRLNEIAPAPDLAVNLGALKSSGLGTHSAAVRHPAPGAVRSDQSSGAAAYQNRNGYAVTTLPYNSKNNGDITGSGTGSAGTPFTFEAWLRPMRDRQGGQCPVNNRWPKLGHRTGWVIFQRFPNASYANVPGINNEGHGWCFRMFDGATGSGHDVLTGTDYEIGKWQHLVVTWEPEQDFGDPGGTGNNQWQGVLTAYVDGVPVASNTAALYAANANPPEDGGEPADLAIGAYNAASTLGNNPFEGDVAELAIYNNCILTPDQIQAHYQAGINSTFGTNYATLVMTAPAERHLETFGAPIPEGTIPATYLRLNDTAYSPAANSGSLGDSAAANLCMTTNVVAGPRPPAYAGFETANTGLPLDGSKQWASLNNPAGLNLTGQITLEAWVKPGAAQADPARILSHGPPTLTDYPVAPPDGALTNSSEVFLMIDGAGANYVVGSTKTIYTNNVEFETTTYAASFPVPAGDLGGDDWIHLVGAYDGANWKLYRNGVRVATSAAAVGALSVTDGDWAIGAAGNGWAGNFAGEVDEVAIYDQALSDASIATHYLMGKAGTAALSVVKSGVNVTITWPAGTTLQHCSTVNGIYEDVPGSPVSPLTLPASGTKFYRWRL